MDEKFKSGREVLKNLIYEMIRFLGTHLKYEILELNRTWGIFKMEGAYWISAGHPFMS